MLLILKSKSTINEETCSVRSTVEGHTRVLNMCKSLRLANVQLFLGFAADDVVGAGTFLHTCAVYWCSISRHLQLQCQLSESHTVVCPFSSGLHCTPSVHHSCDIFVMPSSSHSLRVLARHRHTFHSKLLQEIWWKYTGGWRWRDSTVFKHRISL